MAITKAFMEANFKAARTFMAASNTVIRHETWEYTGTRLPYEQGEQVDLAGAMFTITGGVRLIVSELAAVWPMAGDPVSVRIDGSQWKTYTIISARLDENEVTMLVTYGERFDEEGI